MTVEELKGKLLKLTEEISTDEVGLPKDEEIRSAFCVLFVLTTALDWGEAHACAGLMSEFAQERFLEALGESEEELRNRLN